jgi:MFS family permease
VSTPSRHRPSLFDQVFNLTYWVPFLRPGISVPGDTVGGDFALAPTSGRFGSERRIRRSLTASAVDGSFAEVVTAFSQGSVLTAWALYVGGNAFFIGLLAAMPFVSQLCHVPAAWVTARFGRKRVTLWATGVGRQLYWLLVPLPFVPLSPAAQQAVLLSVALVQGVLGVIGNNAWVSWMGDLVPPSLRGRYFGRRNAIATLGGTLAAFVAGVTIDQFQHNGHMAIALCALAAGAAVAGFITVVALWKMHDPAAHRVAQDTSVAAMLRPFLDARVRPFLTYQAVWNFAVALASTFIPIFMVQNLHMSFSLVAVHASTLALFRIIASPLWGRVMDKVGARPVLVLCSFGICALPFIWLFPTEGRIWPVFIDAVVSGTLWAGHAVAIFSLPFNLAPKDGRPFYLGAFTAVGGLFFALASTLGGLFADALPASFIILGRPMVNLHVLFALSFCARILASSLALRMREHDSSSLTETVRVAGEELSGLRARATRFGFPLVRR